MTYRRRTLIVFSVFLLLLTVLAAGLSNLELKDGIKFDFQQVTRPQALSGGVMDAGLWPFIIKVILATGTLIAPIYLIYMLIDKKRRKRLLFDLVGFGILFFLLNLLRESMSKNPPLPAPGLMISGGGLTPIPEVSGTPMPAVPVPSDGLITITAIVLSVVAVSMISLFFVMMARRRRPEPNVMIELATQAEEAIDALITGENLRETILLCYRRMTEIAAKHRNLPREISVTPHEFETLLVANGMPANSVHELTRLFEDVRYGDQNVGEEDRERAITALRVILAVSRPAEQPA